MGRRQYFKLRQLDRFGEELAVVLPIHDDCLCVFFSTLIDLKEYPLEV